jgi:signal transduction histidine kinase
MVENIALVMAITVVGAIVLSWVMASHVTSPIRALSAAAEALSRGDFQDALAERPVRRSDEIGALDAAFRHMAGQLSDRHARLQQRIGLTEEELRKSEDKLRKSIEGAARSERLVSLGRLASGVAHEVRTPLTSLKLYLQSLREDLAGSKEQTEDFEVAMRQVRRMESTINHFLDFARPREPALADVDLERLVEDALVVVQPRANEQDVEVVRSVAPDLPTLRGDVRQLGEALVNLLVNALDVMPDGGRLTISVAPHQEEPAADDRRWLRIDVADTGPGIREVDMERLFEPFFTTKAAGSGLGLAIVQGTVERHGGKVKVQSRVDEGTTFSMLLPASS